jgi:hypothetical protein
VSDVYCVWGRVGDSVLEVVRAKEVVDVARPAQQGLGNQRAGVVATKKKKNSVPLTVALPHPCRGQTIDTYPLVRYPAFWDQRRSS